MVDVEDRQLVEARLEQRGKRLLADLVAGLGVDFARLRIVEILRDVLPVEVGVSGEQGFQALLGKLAGRTHRQLAASLDCDLSGVGVDQVDGGLQAFRPLGIKGTRHRHSCACR